MLFSIIIPSYNSEKYLEATLLSVLSQKSEKIQLEIIVVDGNSTDETHKILEKYSDKINKLIVEPDNGPAEAINKGFALCSGDVVSWLSADDIYLSGALSRVADQFKSNPEAVFCFGKCPIINEQSKEIRQGITKFKELFFPLNSRFTFQCINYISQPAAFFTGAARKQVGLLREDMIAAWDYEFFLRLWSCGRGVEVKGDPISFFRWHEQSISGQNFHIQFKEELEAAVRDAGKISLQSFLHAGVRWGIIGVYSAMALLRKQKKVEG